MESIDSESNRPCLPEDMSARIRTILLKHVDKSVDLAFHVTSDLNWLRYLKQVEFLERTIPLRSRVLDLGCGLGHTTALLASSCEDINIVGADIKKHSSWEELKKFGCEFCTCDATSLPFLQGNFDVIVSFGVMEHVDIDIEFLKEANRCLRKGGYNILFQLPNKYSISECLSRELGLWHHERTYSSNNIKELIKMCGFNIRCIYKEHLIPAQVNRVSRILADAFDRNHDKIYKLDTMLSKTPLSVFSQDYIVVSEKL